MGKPCVLWALMTTEPRSAFPDPAPAANTASEKASQAVVEYRFTSDKPPPVAQHIKPIMRRFLPAETKGLRALDVGCGNGHWASVLQSWGMDVTGVDPSGVGMAMARKNNPNVRFEQMAATPTLLKDLNIEPFDVVISVEVVEHVLLPRDWVKSCYEALKPGGTLVCTTPYHGYLKNMAISVLDGWDHHINPFWDFGHIKFWSRKTLSKLLTDQGFTDLKFGGAGRVPYLWQSMVMAAKKPR